MWVAPKKPRPKNSINFLQYLVSNLECQVQHKKYQMDFADSRPLPRKENGYLYYKHLF